MLRLRLLRRSFSSQLLAALQQPQPSVAEDIGQPSPSTHPHLLLPGELTPGIAAAEYAARRAALFARLPDDSLVVLPSAPELFFSGTQIPVPSAYRQHSDLFYLTGLAQPDCVAVLSTGRGGAGRRFALAVPPFDSRHRAWHGPRVDAAAAVSFFGADEAVETPRLSELFRSRLRGAQHVFADAPLPLHLSSALGGASSPTHAALQPGGAAAVVAPLRWRKSRAEVALLRASAVLSAAGLRCAAGAADPERPFWSGGCSSGRWGGALARTEAHPAAAHEARIRAGGAARLAYPTVSAAGRSGVGIHHGRYDAELSRGDTFLMDAGCELHGYVSDVTRTWPMSRRFSAPQRALYEAVREAHGAALAAARPGVSPASLHAASVAALSSSIAALGLAPGMGGAAVAATGAYFRFYPHALSHWLGLDTHDTPSISGSSPLVAGNVITIEPGLYVPHGSAGVPPQFWGLAVRIEDDVLITETGCEVLSASAPVDATHVEDWAEDARGEAREADAKAGGARGGKR